MPDTHCDTVTVDRVLSWGPCDRYTDDDAALLRSLLPEEGLTPLEVCDLAEVPVQDRLWALLREEILPARVLRLLACRWAEGALLRERAAGREPDQRSWAAIEVSSRYARGEATPEELSAAWAAALAAALAAAEYAAWAAAWAAALAATEDATWAAAWATAEDANRDAARDAARDAEAAQLADVRAEIVRIEEDRR